MAERDEIFRDIQMILAGHSEKEVIAALLTSLVVAVGVASDTLKRAESVIDALPIELKPILRENWADYRKHHARGNMIRSMGDVPPH